MFSFGLWADMLSKAVGHKYIKRIPYTVRGKQRYRYIYKVTHSHQGRHAFDEAHLQVGTAFSLSTKAGSEYHGHIVKIEGDKISYRIDDGPEKGTIKTESKRELLAKLNDVHDIESKLSSERDKLRNQIKVARKNKASEKQIARLESRLKRLGEKQEPEKQGSLDATLRRMIPSKMIAESIPTTRPISLESLVGKVLNVSGAPSLSPENREKVRDYIRGEVDEMLSSGAIDTYLTSRPHDALFTPTQETQPEKREILTEAPAGKKQVLGTQSSELQEIVKYAKRNAGGARNLKRDVVALNAQFGNPFFTDLKAKVDAFGSETRKKLLRGLTAGLSGIDARDVSRGYDLIETIFADSVIRGGVEAFPIVEALEVHNEPVSPRNINGVKVLTRDGLVSREFAVAYGSFPSATGRKVSGIYLIGGGEPRLMIENVKKHQISHILSQLEGGRVGDLLRSAEEEGLQRQLLDSELQFFDDQEAKKQANTAEYIARVLEA